LKRIKEWFSSLEPPEVLRTVDPDADGKFKFAMALYGWEHWTRKFKEWLAQERAVWEKMLAQIEDVPHRADPEICLSRIQEET
jgi:hypothetical protein